MKYKHWDSIEDTILKVWCDQESCEQLAKRLDCKHLVLKKRMSIKTRYGHLK
jgi:hypothetical protein